MKKRKTKSDAPFAVPNWPAAKVEMRALSKIKDYPNNPRTHPESQIDALATLMKKYGPDQPIVVDENGVILKGHGRKQSAIKAGFEEFPVVVHVGLSEDDKRAVRISDNQIALLSSWNPELLRLEVSELKLAGFDMPLLGFDEAQLFAFSIGFERGSTNPNDEWQGMPEFGLKDKTAFKSIVIHFKDQGGVDKFSALIKAKITESTRFIWFPEIEIERYADKRYKAT